MKAWVAIALFVSFAGSASAQYKGARSYTQRALPQTAPTNSAAKANSPAAARGADPKKTNAPAPAAPAPPVVRVVPPPPPADPNKAKAQREEQLRKTIEFQKKRAEEGSPSAQYDLGLRYLTGDGVDKDEESGRRWLENSAKAGHTPAIRKLEQLGKKEQ